MENVTVYDTGTFVNVQLLACWNLVIRYVNDEHNDSYEQLCTYIKLYGCVSYNFCQEWCIKTTIQCSTTKHNTIQHNTTQCLGVTCHPLSSG